MFDQFRLKDVLVRYKQDFVSMQWMNEKYKWEAVKWFQDHWDVNAAVFPTMLNAALDILQSKIAQKPPHMSLVFDLESADGK